MNVEPLMAGAVETLLFLELSNDQVVEPAAAVAMMEQIAATLQRLEPNAKSRFLQYLCDRADRTTDRMERHALERLPNDLGLELH